MEPSRKGALVLKLFRLTSKLFAAEKLSESENMHMSQQTRE
jgi:hypothetical protein